MFGTRAIGQTLIPFSPNSAWINEILDGCGQVELPNVELVSDDARCFDLLLALYRHGALRSDDVCLQETSKALMNARDALYRRVRAFRLDSSQASFNSLGLIVTGEPLRVRSFNSWIDSPNIFTSSFRPPIASEMRRIMPIFLKISSRRIARLDTANGWAGTALGVYFILLTIHPFADGNGRAARALFANLIARVSGISSLLLIGLPLMQRHVGSAFHLAAKLARMGDATALVDLFLESVSNAGSRFHAPLGALGDAIAMQDLAAAQGQISLLRKSLHDSIYF